MARNNRVTWTVLPNGLSTSSAGKVKLTVLATLILQGGDSDRLADADYQAFQDWPASLTQAKTQWTITFRGSAGTQNPVYPANADFISGLNSDMWKAAFPLSLPVRPRTGSQNYQDSDVGSYPGTMINAGHREHRIALATQYLTQAQGTWQQTVADRFASMNLYLHPKGNGLARTSRVLASSAEVASAAARAQVSARAFVERVRAQDPVLRRRLGRDLARLERSVGTQVKAEVLIGLVDHHQRQLLVPNPTVAMLRAAELAQTFYYDAGIDETTIASFNPQLQFALFHFRPEMSISRFSPNTVAANRPTVLNVYGHGFRAGLTAVVSQGLVGKPVFTDSMNVQMEVTVAATGPCTLTLVNPNGQSHSITFPVAASSAVSAAESTDNRNSDFHQVVTMLGQFPVLLRPLGLAFDLEVDPPATGSGTVEVSLAPSPVAQISAQTNYTYDGQTFQAAARDNTLLSGRMLNVTDANGFQLVIDDVNGSNLKDMLHAQSTDRAGEFQSQDTPDDADNWPSARSGGITLLHDQRGDRIKAAIAPSGTTQQMSQAVATGATPPPLYAEDLVLGYRVDIWDDYSGQWHSLCERTGVYKFTDARESSLQRWVPPDSLRPLEEGFIQPAATTPGDSQDQVQVNPAIFCWSGWSLSTPYPARTMNPSKGPNGNKPLRVEPEFTVKEKSLPALRFGASYSARCRAVDLAGNSLAPTPSDDPAYRPVIGDPAGTLLTYRRWEPVASPILLLADELDPTQSPGEQIDRPTVRDGEGGVERFLVPPRVPQHFAEIHSKFDKGGLPDGAFAHVVLNADGSFPAFSDSGSAKVAQRNAYFQYDGHYNQRPNCSYFPDPLAEKARVKGWRLDSFRNRRADGQTDFDITIPFLNGSGKLGPINSWPDVFPIHLRIVPSPGDMVQGSPKAPQLDWDFVDENDIKSRLCPTLTVYLRESEVIEIELSSTLPNVIEKGPNQQVEVAQCLAIVDPTQQFMRAQGVVGTAATPFLSGDHPMVSPAHDMTLVHAVKTPREGLKFGANFLVQRTMLDTKPATVFGNIQVDWFSTARLVCQAKYTDWVDELSEPGPRQVETQEQAFEIQATDDPDNRKPSAKQHVFRDTRYHEVTYALISTSRFRDYYPKENENAFQIRSGAFMPLVVNSSQRPAAPSIVYAIPSFEKQEGFDKNTNTRRVGKIGAIRVYLNRPWYSSGSKERLGVVYPGTGGDPLDPKLGDFVTRWGVDPIWKAGGLTQPSPAINDFQGYLEKQSGCPLVESSASVDVVGYEVHYDSARQLWYSDVQILPQHAYFPFVRLSLVRFQPNSIPGAHISAVAMSDFAQIAPTRWAHVHVRHKTVTLCVSGVTYSTSLEGAGRGSIVQVTVQERSHGEGEDLGWVTPSWGGPFRDFRITNQGDLTMWEKTLSLAHSPSLFKYRLRIEEFEQILGDGDGSGNRDLGRTHSVERLVYAEMFAL